MNNFIIYLVNNKISVFDENYNSIKKEGEVIFGYTSFFWEWFLEKIEYENEELSFVIVSDKEMHIPKNIKICEKSSFRTLPKIKQYPNTKIYTYPKIEKIETIKKRKTSKTLMDLMIEKTAQYKGQKSGN